jgi:DNA-binding MarR family transcriptional regulator
VKRLLSGMYRPGHFDLNLDKLKFYKYNKNSICVYTRVAWRFAICRKVTENMKNITESYPKCSSPCNCLNIRRASRAVTQFYDKVLEPSGLKITQLSLLRYIELLGPIAISELAKAMRIDRTTLNRNMKPLADASLIAINPGKDPRTRQVVLTEAGKAAMVTAWELWGEAQAELKEYLGEEDLGTLVKLLSRLEALVP